MTRLERDAAEALARLDALGLRREIRPARGIDFASNDYLGLRSHPEVIAAARAALEEHGAGAGAARLLRGDHPEHRALEEEMARHQGAEDGLLFSSGFHANLGVLQSLATEGWRIVSDERNHASIIDGCRAAKADTVVVPHNDLDAFEDALRGERTLVVTEHVFSMTGDRAPLGELSALCARVGAALVIDEAHALGLFPCGPGAVLRVNPCGKAMAAAGAVVTGPRAILDLLRSRCRTFLFTTALPPSVPAAALAALRVARRERGRAERALALARRLHPPAQSCIVPIACEDSAQALLTQGRLAELGLDVRAVRPPSVPRAILRVSVHADRTEAEVDLLRASLVDLGLL